MNIDMGLLVVGLIFSSVGFIFLSYGRKQGRLNLIVFGVALMLYPYFVESTTTSLVLGVALSVLPFLFSF